MSFLQSYQLLRKSIPVPAVSIGQYTQNSEYIEYIYGSKNCKYCYIGTRLEESMHCFCSWGTVQVVDCFFCAECELCYECVDCTKCYSSIFLQDCHNCRDCHYSLLCVSCSDCFGCVGLTRKQYYMFNKQYTKEDYFKKLKELRSKKSQEILEQVKNISKKIPRPQSHQENNINCPYGDYIYNSKNVYWGFDAWYVEDSGYFYSGGLTKNCWDMYMSGKNMELCYEMNDVARCYNCAYLFISENCTNCFFGTWLRNCNDCWGCVGLSNKKYCILNNQLTKEQYEKAVVQIKKELGWRVG